MSAYNALGLVGLYQELRETVHQVRPEGPKQVVLAVFANACWWAGTNVRRLGREADTFLCDLGTAAEAKLRANRRVRWEQELRTKYAMNLTKALQSVYFGKWIRLKNENGRPIGRECMMGWPSESGTLGADAEIDSHGNFIVRRRIGTGISALDTWDPRDENWVVLCRGNAQYPASAKIAVEAAVVYMGGVLDGDDAERQAAVSR